MALASSVQRNDTLMSNAREGLAKKRKKGEEHGRIQGETEDL
ncbi:hypothetical protein COLO4_35547 [Corchorus olitorius]|uniref:Uncharacterized protein n=1 Tax=Corchorus olitorius TaxID=93759 RepID=A0A1R3GFH3_9ROSI|nr:hypothetical protein COLO4_35547 [Corchorus olitorius]